MQIEVDKKQYEEDQKELAWLSCLEQAGVDNWEGYDEARRIFREQFPQYIE